MKFYCQQGRRIAGCATWAAVCTWAAVVAAQPAVVAEEAATDEEGFVALAAEDAADHWRGYQEEAWPSGWEIVDGVIHRIGGGSDLVTKDEYGSFDLRLEWKIEPGGNSGILYRVSLGDPAPYMSGLECQVLDNQRNHDGKSPLTSAGALYALYPPEPDTSKPAGEWNEARVLVRGNQIQHFLNGKKVVDAELGSTDWNERLAKSKFANWPKFAKNAKGHITLQDHGNHVWYRNVRVKPLEDEAAAE